MNRDIAIYLALTLAAIVVVVGASAAYRRQDPAVVIDAPAVHIESDKATGDTRVDAPFAKVQKDQSGTRVQAPGVDIVVPKRQTD